MTKLPSTRIAATCSKKAGNGLTDPHREKKTIGFRVWHYSHGFLVPWLHRLRVLGRAGIWSTLGRQKILRSLQNQDLQEAPVWRDCGVQGPML
jgi:hypothetical protein